MKRKQYRIINPETNRSIIDEKCIDGGWRNYIPDGYAIDMWDMAANKDSFRVEFREFVP